MTKQQGRQDAGTKVVHGDSIDVGEITHSGAVAIGRDARATINNYTEIIVKADSFEDLPPAPGEPPFKGLAYFTEQDAAIFFGREELSEDIAARLQKERFLAVIGASGSGKSSLLRAGVVPRMRRRNWSIQIMTPTSRPLERLATVLAAGETSLTAADELAAALRDNPRALLLAANKLASQADTNHLLLIVDQFEELFTLCRDEEERQQFIDQLLAAVAAEGAATILIGLRADFYDRCAAYEGLRDLVSQKQEFIGPMRQEDLVRVIAEPARRGGWQFVDGLVEQILEDVGREPGRLPLLSHALLETWELRRGTVMTLGGYRAAGGVEGAIAKTAENTLRTFDQRQLAIVERVFLSLTELGGQAEDTRRIATKEELVRGDSMESVDAVLEDLVRARLITIDDENVEVAHEALIRRWPRLADWLEENRDRLQVERQLLQDARQWEAAQKDPAYLYRGLRLEQALAWLAQSPDPPVSSAQAFLAASQAAAREEEERARQLQAAQRRQRALAAVAVVLLLIAGLAAAYGLNAFSWLRDPGKMTGGFNIAVAMIDEAEGAPPGSGAAASTRIAAGLSSALAGSPAVQIWVDSPQLRREENVVIGVIDDSSPEQAPQNKAESLQADMLVYGTVLPQGSGTILQLHTYLTPQVGEELANMAGIYQFTTPLPLVDPLAPGLEIQKPVEALAAMALGLNYSQLGQGADALDQFRQAAGLMPQSDMAHYFVGQELFDLATGGGAEAEQQLDQAEAAFLRALEAGENTRAQIGLAAVRLNRAQALLSTAQEADCALPQNEARLNDALAQTVTAQELLQDVPQQPLAVDLAAYGRPVSAIALLNQAILQRIEASIHTCLGDPQAARVATDHGLAALDSAEPDFQTAGYHRSLARLYEARGTLYHLVTFLLVQDQDPQSIETLQKGIQAFGQCLQQAELVPADEFLQTVIRPLCEEGLADLQAAGGIE